MGVLVALVVTEVIERQVFIFVRVAHIVGSICEAIQQAVHVDAACHGHLRARQ
jgi:hypothetical protein